MNIDIPASMLATIVDSTGTTKATISVPASTTLPTRIRSAFTPNAGFDNYRVTLDGTTTTTQLQVVTARMLVNQTGATKTKLYIPLLSSNFAASSADVGAPIAVTSSASFLTIGSASIYVRDPTVYSSLNNFNAWEL